MIIDRRKKTVNLIKETIEYIETELQRLDTLETKSQFEKGRWYAFLEMKIVFKKILFKEER